MGGMTERQLCRNDAISRSIGPTPSASNSNMPNRTSDTPGRRR
jgi:hypothetical protein